MEKIAYRWDIANGTRTDATAADNYLFERRYSAHGRGEDPYDGYFDPESDWPHGIVKEDFRIGLLASDGSIRAHLNFLPGEQWVTILADGLTYIGSEDCEAHLLLVERDGFATRPLDDAFIAAHRRDRLDLGPLPSA